MVLIGSLKKLFELTMPEFPQLPGEPSDAFAQLVVHRDAGPTRLYRETADLTGASESTLRRRAERWSWQRRLDIYDAELLRQMEMLSTEDALRRHAEQLKKFRDIQLERAHRLGELADELMGFIHYSLLQHQHNGLVLQGREISSLLASSCKSLEASMDIEAVALGVSELLEDIGKSGV